MSGMCVPQGSVLGPLMYTTYTSQMYNCLKSCNIDRYADYTQIYYITMRKRAGEINVVINIVLKLLKYASKDHSLHKF